MKHLQYAIVAALWHFSTVYFRSTAFTFNTLTLTNSIRSLIHSHGGSNDNDGCSRYDFPIRAKDRYRNRTSCTTRRHFFRDSSVVSMTLAVRPCYSSDLEDTADVPSRNHADIVPLHNPSTSISIASSITVPLIFTGQELLISYKVDDSRFRAVLDTGSPFLMVPGSCGFNTKQKSGCYRNQGRDTGLETTIEIFDGFEGEVEWRRGAFDFLNVTDDEGRPGTMITLLKGEDNDVIFGVASEDIMGGPGGVFFGLIKNTDARIRPSFLGQTNVQAFQVDLRSSPFTLTLFTRPMIDASSTAYIPMTNVLRRRYGDPVGHYTARASSIYVNGYPLLESSNSIFVIFDTGVTGMIVSRGLFNEQYANARKRKDKSLFGNVTLTFQTQGVDSTNGTGTASLSAMKPLTTPFDPEEQWKRLPKSTHIIVLGLAFLEQHVTTVDIEMERISIS